MITSVMYLSLDFNIKDYYIHPCIPNTQHQVPGTWQDLSKGFLDELLSEQLCNCYYIKWLKKDTNNKGVTSEKERFCLLAGAQGWSNHSVDYICDAFWNWQVDTWMQQESWISTLCKILLQALRIGGLREKGHRESRQYIILGTEILKYTDSIFLCFFLEKPKQLSASLKMAFIFSHQVHMPLPYYNWFSKWGP